EGSRAIDARRPGVRRDGPLGPLGALMQAVPAASGLVEREQVAERVHLVVWGQPGSDRLVAERMRLRALDVAERELRSRGTPLDQRQVVWIVEPLREPKSPSR